MGRVRQNTCGRRPTPSRLFPLPRPGAPIRLGPFRVHYPRDSVCTAHLGTWVSADVSAPQARSCIFPRRLRYRILTAVFPPRNPCKRACWCPLSHARAAFQPPTLVRCFRMRAALYAAILSPEQRRSVVGPRTTRVARRRRTGSASERKWDGFSFVGAEWSEDEGCPEGQCNVRELPRNRFGGRR